MNVAAIIVLSILLVLAVVMPLVVIKKVSGQHRESVVKLNHLSSLVLENRAHTKKVIEKLDNGKVSNPK